MRPFILLAAIALSACGQPATSQANEADTANNASAAQLPPPKTPVLNVSGAPGNEATWIEPRDDRHAPVSSPYNNLLDQPVVGDGRKR